MAVTREELFATAALAQLDVPEQEVEALLQALAAILGYVDKLSEVDVSGVEPMSHAVAMSLRLREDEVVPQLSTEEALSSAPRRNGSFIEVPQILAHDKGER